MMNGPLLFLPTAVSSTGQAISSFKRISRFLLEDELDEDSVEKTQFGDVAIKIEEGEFSWGDESAVLKSINIKIETGQLVAVVGPVGTGKSSLLSAMFGEMNKISGRVTLKGSLAYVPQQAWIQNMTLKDNILFGKQDNDVEYNRTIQACALVPDLQMLPGGEMTEIGEKGINLSGGQKQRVSLARAVYQDRDIYLLDDPLSAVDVHVGQHLFQRVIGENGVLQGKTRILATHNVQILPQMDFIIVVGNGSILDMGTFENLVKKNGPFAEYLKTYFSEQAENNETEKLDLKGILQSMSENEDNSVNETMGMDNQHILRHRKKGNIKIDKNDIEIPKKAQGLTEEEKTETGSIGFNVLKIYGKAVGLLCVTIALVFCILYGGCLVLINLWLSDWSNDATLNVKTAQERSPIRLGVYAGIIVALVVTGFVLSLSVATGVANACYYLHKKLLQRIIRAPMSFFDTTPTGRLLNRFSRDMDAIDVDLFTYLLNWILSTIPILTILIVATYTTPFILIVIAIFLTFLIVIQRVYAVTSNQLMRIDALQRSPIYAFFDESLSGLSSIRAYQDQKRFIEKSDRLLDESQKAYCHLLLGQWWVLIVCQILGTIFAFCTSLFVVLQRESLTGGIAAMAISYSMEMKVRLSLMVFFATKLESQIVSVERINEYMNIDTEPAWVINDKRPPISWPNNAQVDFQKYSTRYRNGLDLVVKDVTISVAPQEKVGVVGRTGAGKSSMVLSLFRIIEAAEGAILVDGVNIGEIGLHDLRARLSIIPQDPVVFSGSIRMNLDPFEAYSDVEIWTALEHAHLKGFVSTLFLGLDYDCGEGGQSLSVGQRQLICLARALLKKNRILILDEATAAVDLETDDLIQQTIRTQFQHCTVLTIAHRVNTIMDYDKICVLDNGKVNEFDTPDNLLKNHQSIFYSMAHDAGLV